MSKKRVNREILLSYTVTSQFSAPVKRSVGINNQNHSQSAQRGVRPWLCPGPWKAGFPHRAPITSSLVSAP